jgi:hypothetical protein
MTTLGVLLAVIFAYRLLISHLHHLRLAASIASTVSSNYFAQPLSRGLCFVQKHILLAPLWSRRHNEAFQTTRLYLGTLPSRLNVILLFAYISSNILYCSLYLPWNGNIGPDGKLRAPTKAALIAEFRGRTGVMATVNMVPLFICMMRNNYLGKMAGVGFNTWNLYHRWAGRIVFLEAFAHVTAWWINQVNQSGENGVSRAFSDSRFLRMGLLVRIFRSYLHKLCLLCVTGNHLPDPDRSPFCFSRTTCTLSGLSRGTPNSSHSLPSGSLDALPH